jgi:hypothetical protein
MMLHAFAFFVVLSSCFVQVVCCCRKFSTMFSTGILRRVSISTSTTSRDVQ